MTRFGAGTRVSRYARIPHVAQEKCKCHNLNGVQAVARRRIIPRERIVDPLLLAISARLIAPSLHVTPTHMFLHVRGD